MNSRASSVSRPKSPEPEADWWKEAAQSFSPTKITSETSHHDNNNNYGSTAPPSVVTSPNRYNSYDEENNPAWSAAKKRGTSNIGGKSYNMWNNILSRGSQEEEILQQPTLSDISNDSSASESDDDFSSYASDDSVHSLERPHRTVGLIFFDTLRLIAITADVRYVNTEMVPVLLAWKTMDSMNKLLR